jgi:hypothetical protein
MNEQDILLCSHCKEGVFCKLPGVMPAAHRLGTTSVVTGDEHLGEANNGGGGGGGAGGKQMNMEMLNGGCVMEGNWLIRGDM